MKRGTPRHPKVGRLCELLGISVPTAVGYLELLWHFTAEFAPQGDIGKYDDNRIEAALLSQFRPKGKLIQALIKASWIDQDPISRLIVHDWFEHADASVRKRLDRAGFSFVAVNQKVTIHRPSTMTDVGSLPEPEPSQILSMPEPEPRAEQAQPRGYQFDEMFSEFRAACRDWGMNLVEPDDFYDAFRWSWLGLDPSQRQAAVTAIRDRIAAGINPLSWKPKNFLKSEWKRKVTPLRLACRWEPGGSRARLWPRLGRGHVSKSMSEIPTNDG